MAKGNPSPVMSDGFKAKQKPRVGDKALGKTIGVRVEQHIDEILKDKTLIPDRQLFIREAISAALREKGLLN